MSDVDLGYALSSEEFGPNELVEQAARAEEVGFDFASISDHYHPWLDAQGESPFVWTTLGGIARATDDLDLGVGVTCPTMRTHPAVIAQAVATVTTMFDGRFFFGVGTGENLNEHVIGEHWPEHPVRMEMLEESIEVIRKLWKGKQTSHHGDHYDVQNACLYTLPEKNPPVVASAFGPKTAAASASFADGFWTTGPAGDLLDAYREEGGEGPAYTQLTACYADSEDEAIATVYEYWRQSLLPGELNQILPTPTHFEQATQMVSEDDVAAGPMITHPDADTHIENIERAIEAGYDHVYVHQVGPDQESFFELYEEEVLPSFE